MSLAEAFRDEFKRILEVPDFNYKTCMRLEQLARAARAALASTAGVDNAIDHIMGPGMGEYVGVGGSSTMTFPGVVQDFPPAVMSPAPASETFGVKVIREALAAMPQILKSREQPQVAVPEDPLNLVRAIKEARDAGLNDVAEALVARIVGGDDDTSKPVDVGFDDVGEPAEATS